MRMKIMNYSQANIMKRLFIGHLIDIGDPCSEETYCVLNTNMKPIRKCFWALQRAMLLKDTELWITYSLTPQLLRSAKHSKVSVTQQVRNWLPIVRGKQYQNNFVCLCLINTWCLDINFLWNRRFIIITYMHQNYTL